MTAYYVAENGTQKGPFTLAEIQDQCSRGIIQAQTLMWRDGLGDWQAAAIVLQGTGVTFSSDAQPPRPPPLASEEHSYDEPFKAGLRFEVPAASLSAGRGVSWIGEGWGLFKVAPGMWVAALLVWALVQIALTFVPFLGSIAGILLGPSFAVGLLAFAHGVSINRSADLSLLFAGFKEKFSALVILGLLYLVMVVVVFAVGGILAFMLIGSALSSHTGTPEQFALELFTNGGITLLLALALFLVLIAPVIMAYMYAPALVFFANQSAGEAMKQSFNACLRNWLPIGVFGLLAIVLAFIGSIPFGLGLLIVLPLLFAANYASFKDMFGR